MRSFTLRDAARVVIGWDPEERITSETAWLNGVRGLAAFLVLMTHWSWDYLTFMAEAPFGALMLRDSFMNSALPFHEGSRLWAPWRLPILHVFFSSGGGQVSLFFVISGFVLTWGSLGLAQSENYSKLYSSLGSSVFRRWSRLFLPCIIVNYIYAFQQDIQDNRNVLWGIWTYLGEAVSWINPFKSVSENQMAPLQQHNAVVWTIPYEFSGSIYVFVLALMLGRFRFSRRFPIMILLASIAFYSAKSYLWLFGAGMALADWARHAKLLRREPLYQPRLWQNILWWVVMVFGLTLLGWPKPMPDVYTRPGYDWDEHIPLPGGWKETIGSDSAFHGTGAIIVIASACHLRLFRKLFETPLLQYLGKLSFMLYLIHIMIGGEVGRRIQRAAYAGLCTYGDDQKISGIQICQINSFLHIALLVSLYLIGWPCVFVASNILERFVDRPCTQLGKVVDVLLLRKWPTREQAPPAAAPEEDYLLDPRRLDDLELGDAEELKLESEDSSKLGSDISSESELPLHERGVP